MVKHLLKLLGCLVVFLVILGIPAIYVIVGPGGICAKVNRPENQTIIIEKGMGISQISALLTQKGLVAYPHTFYGAVLLASVLAGKWKIVQAGEFMISSKSRPIDIIEILCSSKPIVHSLTIPEGLTIMEIVKKIQDTPLLKGEISRIPSEGYAFPETYVYVYGDSRQALLDQMEAQMRSALETCWQARGARLPYEGPHQALIMASIVEKETSETSERPRVAAVFVNRLRKGMRLQADPTVIYGLTLGKERLGRSLTKADLKSETPYNTYGVAGLPPHPIACPGKASLEAALNPVMTQEIYFVANGEGGHHFSETLDQHNLYVRQCRKNPRRSQR